MSVYLLAVRDRPDTRGQVQRVRPASQRFVEHPISSTMAGSRTRGKKPSANGASRPAATTMSRLVNMGSRFQLPGVTRLTCAARRM